MTTPSALAEAGTAEVIEAEFVKDEAQTKPGVTLVGAVSVPSWLSHDHQAAVASRERGAPPTPPPER